MVRQSTAAGSHTAIKRARIRAGLTQAQSAELVGVTLSGWQRWEQGERKMPEAAWTLYRILTLPGIGVIRELGKGDIVRGIARAARRLT